MKRYRMLIEYEGTRYVGWQVQREGLSIQGLLQEALERVTGEAGPVVAAGRTDAGVHALGQVASFHSTTRLPPEVLLRALNANLAADIRVLKLEEAPADFHPRYTASGKRYVYLIQNQTQPSVFAGRWAWTVSCPLDVTAMQTAFEALVGRHDFSAFRGAGCGARNPVRNVTRILVERPDFCEVMGLPLTASLVRITVEADAFLRHMVRNLVGFGVEVGRGRLNPSEASRILQGRDRRENRAPTAPAQGLFLVRVFYPAPVFQDHPKVSL